MNRARLEEIYRETKLKRIPISGFIEGYHTLPFTLIGPNDKLDKEEESKAHKSLMLKGKIQVSQKILFSLGPDSDDYGSAFPEEESFMDQSLVGRVFSFGVANRKNLKVKNEFLTIEEVAEPAQDLLARKEDEFMQREETREGLIWCPKPHFYPISLERFIEAVLDKELPSN